MLPADEAAFMICKSYLVSIEQRAGASGHVGTHSGAPSREISGPGCALPAVWSLAFFFILKNNRSAPNVRLGRLDLETVPPC